MLNAAFQIVMRGEDKEDRAAAQGRSFNAIFAMPCSPAMALKANIIIRRLRRLGRVLWAELRARVFLRL